MAEPALRAAAVVPLLDWFVVLLDIHPVLGGLYAAAGFFAASYLLAGMAWLVMLGVECRRWH